MTVPLARDAGAPVWRHLHEQEQQLARLALARMTARQHEVASLVAIGLTYRRVAEQLGVSAVTVKYHVRRIGVRLPGPATLCARERIIRWYYPVGE